MESGNVRRPGPVPRFSDLEVIALSMAAEAEKIDSENWLFEAKLQECRSSIPNLISRRQFNDRRKSVSGLCEQIRSRIANRIDGGEDYFCIDSKPIEVCRVARGKRCKMGRTGDFNKAPDLRAGERLRSPARPLRQFAGRGAAHQERGRLRSRTPPRGGLWLLCIPRQLLLRI